jgi:glucokinase
MGVAHMAKRGTIGIDIGGTKTLFALFNEKFDVVDSLKIATHAEKGEKHFSEKLEESLDNLMKKATKEDIQIITAGIGSAGVPNDKGTLKECASIPFLKGYPLQSRVAKITGANVYLANDVQAGLYGEYHFGAAVGCQDVLGFFFGTGIGGAAILDGKPYFGATGRAGNIGHYVLQSVGTTQSDVLDNVASRTAIAGDAAALAAKQQAPYLLKTSGTDIRDIRSEDLADAIRKGDKAVEALVRDRARIAGAAISNLVDFLNPEMVLLGGGLVESLPELMTAEIKSGIESHSTPQAFKALKVVPSKLAGHAVTTGAAKLSWDAFLAAPTAEAASAR